MSESRARTSLGVLAVVGAVALLDIATGLFLLVAREPWEAHGPGTLWASAATITAGSTEASALVESLYRRLGAFSLHAGIVTLVGALLGARDRRLMGGLLVLWMVNGLAFFATDRASFAGTPYFVAKQVIGTAWALATVWHLVGPRLAARRA